VWWLRHADSTQQSVWPQEHQLFWQSILLQWHYHPSSCRLAAYQITQLRALVLASHRNGPGSRPGQVMWDLWWTKQHWARLSPSTPVSPAKHSSSLIIIRGGTIGQTVASMIVDSVSHLLGLNTNTTDSLHTFTAAVDASWKSISNFYLSAIALAFRERLYQQKTPYAACVCVP
jgi:hypothetical protein